MFFFVFCFLFFFYREREGFGFPGSSVVKNLHANSGAMDLIPGSGESPIKEMAIHSNVLA